jgi:hypothetical protein
MDFSSVDCSCPAPAFSSLVLVSCFHPIASALVRRIVVVAASDEKASSYERPTSDVIVKNREALIKSSSARPDQFRGFDLLGACQIGVG